MSNNERIDFEELYYEEKQGDLNTWTNKVARLVEEQTIRRIVGAHDNGTQTRRVSVLMQSPSATEGRNNDYNSNARNAFK